MENAELEEIRKLINQLSKDEREKLFANLKRVTFNFQINRSFLTGSHPLTIPKEYYYFLDFHGIVAKKDMTIVFPDGSTAVSYIYHGTAGYGAYRQIKVRNAYAGQGLSSLRIGDVVKVEIYKESSLPRIQLSNLTSK
jgi:hypothetical protein